MLREIRKILKAIGYGRQYSLLLLLRSPISIFMTIVNAAFLQKAFNAITNNDSRQLTIACITFGVASLFTFLYNGILWSAYAAPLSTKMEAGLRLKTFRKISSLSYERIEALPQGELLTRLNTDVQMPFLESLPNMAMAIVSICVSALILWRMNPTIFRLVLLFVITHIVFSQFFIARVMPQLNKKSLEATAYNTGEMTAFITCADISALYDGQDYLMKRFEKSSRDLYRANMRIRSRNALNAGILPLFGFCGYLILLIFSSGWIADGLLTFGDLTSAFQYRSGILSGALIVMNCLINIQANIAGIRRLNETLAE